MISFIVYDGDLKKRELYLNIIKRFLYTSQDFYTIYEFDKYSNKMLDEIEHIEGMKVYLINVDDGFDGLGLARKIRNKGDFVSPLILLTSRDRRDVLVSLRNILYLDIIETDDELLSNLLYSLKEAYRMVTKQSAYTFSSFDEVYRLPYDDIYYIQKNLNDDSVTIYTKDDTYLNYATVKGVCESLKEDPRFFKAHRSCIINLYNVSSFDKKTNTVVFNNGMQVQMVSRYNKSKLVERLKEYSNSI